mmetsp:Transcript_18678/g.52211  ORF Transcript_18678/g.52211 Transcript_18678/m.52211 type:complete len:238 (-) Transcript_18678:397-1110(-)
MGSVRTRRGFAQDIAQDAFHVDQDVPPGGFVLVDGGRDSGSTEECAECRQRYKVVSTAPPETGHPKYLADRGHGIVIVVVVSGASGQRGIIRKCPCHCARQPPRLGLGHQVGNQPDPSKVPECVAPQCPGIGKGGHDPLVGSDPSQRSGQLPGGGTKAIGVLVVREESPAFAFAGAGAVFRTKEALPDRLADDGTVAPPEVGVLCGARYLARCPIHQFGGLHFQPGIPAVGFGIRRR